MKNENDAIEKFGLVCLAVRNMMDEEGLSVEDALKAVRSMLMPHSSSPVVIDGISNLEAAESEADLMERLLKEAERVKRVLHLSRMPWPTSLFD